MKSLRLLGKRSLAGTVAALALALSASAFAQTYMGKVEVRSVRGEAFYSTGPGTPLMPLKNGTVLGPGATLKTAKGGSVDLFLGKSAGTLRVAEETSLTFDKFTITDTGADTVVDLQLNLPEGTILGDVNKLSAASKYEVKLPNGVAGVRGTIYRISSTGYIVVLNGTVIFVYVPPGGQPTPFTLLGPPPVYFSPIEGVRPAPEDLVREVRGQAGPGAGGFRPSPAPIVPFQEPFVSPGTGAKPD